MATIWGSVARDFHIGTWVLRCQNPLLFIRRRKGELTLAQAYSFELRDCASGFEDNGSLTTLRTRMPSRSRRLLHSKLSGRAVQVGVHSCTYCVAMDGRRAAAG